MGVKDLWTLLEPSAERVDLSGLRGKRIAVDASIWMVQFLKRCETREANRFRSRTCWDF